MAHPDRISLALFPHVFGQRAILGDLDLGATKLPVVAALDLAAELVRHRLLAVADAEYRHARLVDRHGSEWRAGFMHRRWPAGEDDRLRLHRPEGFFRPLERYDLAINLF